MQACYLSLKNIKHFGKNTPEGSLPAFNKTEVNDSFCFYCHRSCARCQFTKQISGGFRACLGFTKYKRLLENLARKASKDVAKKWKHIFKKVNLRPHRSRSIVLLTKLFCFLKKGPCYSLTNEWWYNGVPMLQPRAMLKK